MQSPAIEESYKMVEITFCDVQRTLDGYDALLQCTNGMNETAVALICSLPLLSDQPPPPHNFAQFKRIMQSQHPLFSKNPHWPRLLGSGEWLLSPVHIAENVCWIGPSDTQSVSREWAGKKWEGKKQSAGSPWLTITVATRKFIFKGCSH